RRAGSTATPHRLGTRPINLLHRVTERRHQRKVLQRYLRVLHVVALELTPEFRNLHLHHELARADHLANSPGADFRHRLTVHDRLRQDVYAALVEQLPGKLRVLLAVRHRDPAATARYAL